MLSGLLKEVYEKEHHIQIDGILWLSGKSSQNHGLLDSFFKLASTDEISLFLFHLVICSLQEVINLCDSFPQAIFSQLPSDSVFLMLKPFVALILFLWW